MTLFGVIWIALLVWSYFKKKDEYILFLLFLSGVLQCNNVLIINGSGIGPFVITSIAFILHYMTYNFRRYRLSQKKYTLICIWIIFSVLISLISNNANLGDSFVYVAQIFSYILCFIIVQKIGYRINQENLQKMILCIIDFVLIVGIIQYSIFILGLPRYNFIASLLYNDTISTSIAYYATAQMRLFSTFMEPSYCAAFLVGALFYICYNYKNIKNSYFRICVIGIEIILSMSTTAYVAVVICGLMFLIYGHNYKLIVRLLPVILIGLIIVVATGRFDSVIANKLSGGSAAERTMWNNRAIENFLSSPVFGAGYKNSRASSLLLSILAEQGLFGFFAFAGLCIKNFKLLISKRTSRNVKASVWFFIGVLVCQLIACPDFDFCVLWMSMYVLGVSIGMSSLFKEKSV